MAALKEAQEKWSAIYQLLEQKVEEYNSQARQLELAPKTAKHAKGHNLEVQLKMDMAVDGVVKMMGGVDVAGAVKPHVKKLVKGYESEAANEKRRIVEVKDQIESAESSSEQLVEDIEVSCVVLELVLPLNRVIGSRGCAAALEKLFAGRSWGRGMSRI